MKDVLVLLHEVLLLFGLKASDGLRLEGLAVLVELHVGYGSPVVLGSAGVVNSDGKGLLIVGEDPDDMDVVGSGIIYPLLESGVDRVLRLILKIVKR